MHHLSMGDCIAPAIGYLSAHQAVKVPNLVHTEIFTKHRSMLAFSLFSFPQTSIIIWVDLVAGHILIVDLMEALNVFFESALNDKRLIAKRTLMMLVVHGLLVVRIFPALVEHGVALCAVDYRRINKMHSFTMSLVIIPIGIWFVAVVYFAHISNEK